MKRKILSILLVMALAAGLTATAYAAANSDYEMEGSILRGYYGPGGDVVIPDFVTDLFMGAFSRDDITSVVVHGNIKDISDYAFENCTALTDVTLLDGVETIWGGAFAGCTNLTNVVIPETLTAIRGGGGGAFDGCTALKSLRLPASLEVLGFETFNNCPNLTSVYFYGDAPEWENIYGDLDPYEEEGSNSLENCTFYYIEGKAGWTSSTWNGVKTATFTPDGATQEPEKPTALQAHPNASKILVDGIETAFDAYTFYDENGNGTNYIKLRDIAYTLNGTAAQFEVSWDGSIVLTTGKPYTAVGGEMASKGTGDKNAVPNSATILLNGTPVELTAYTIEGNNYFMLRDLGRTLGFNVSWDSKAGTIIIDTNEAYSSAD